MMAIYRFSVIRYVPDARREEYMNVGIVVVADDSSFVGSQFGTNWRRMERFGQEDVGFLKEFARVLRDRSKVQQPLDPTQRLSIETLSTLAFSWKNSIQFSELRAAQHNNPQQLLEYLFGLYVVEKRPSRHRLRTRQDIINRTEREFRQALSRAYIGPELEIKRDQILPGRTLPQPMDIVIQNGAPWLAIECLSFQRAQTEDFDITIKATAYMLGEIRAANEALDLAVVAIPPNGKRRDYDDARTMCKAAGAHFIDEGDLDQWVNDEVERLTVHAAAIT